MGTGEDDMKAKRNKEEGGLGWERGEKVGQRKSQEETTNTWEA